MRIWNAFLSIKEPRSHHLHRYQRLNVPLYAGSEVNDIAGLKQLAQEGMNEPEMKRKAKEIARQLIASSFFLFQVSLKEPCIIGVYTSKCPLFLKANLDR